MIVCSMFIEKCTVYTNIVLINCDRKHTHIHMKMNTIKKEERERISANGNSISISFLYLLVFVEIRTLNYERTHFLVFDYSKKKKK